MLVTIIPNFALFGYFTDRFHYQLYGHLARCLKTHGGVGEGLGFFYTNLPVPILGRVWGILIFFFFPALRGRGGSFGGDGLLRTPGDLKNCDRG